MCHNHRMMLQCFPKENISMFTVGVVDILYGNRKWVPKCGRSLFK